MKVARSVAEVLAEHTTLTLECIDRMYLNVYVPLLQRAAGAAYFFRKMRGAAVPSSALMAPMTQRFVNAIKSFAARNGIEIFRLSKEKCREGRRSRGAVWMQPRDRPAFPHADRAKSLLAPVLQAEPLHPAELADVVGHEHEGRATARAPRSACRWSRSAGRAVRGPSAILP